MIFLNGETDSYQPRPVPFFRPRRIILAKGSCTTAERRALVEKICGVYPGAQVVDDPDTPHNKIDLGRRGLLDRHNLGKRTLVLGELGQAVGESKERGNACPNYRHFSLYGFCPYRCDYCYLAGTRGVCLIDTVRCVRPELEIGLCLEDPTTFERLRIEGNVGRCNCVL